MIKQFPIKPGMATWHDQTDVYKTAYRKMDAIKNKVVDIKVIDSSAQIIIVANNNVFIELAEMIKYSLKELGIKNIDIKDCIEVDFEKHYKLNFIIRAFRRWVNQVNVSGYKFLFQTEECWNDREKGEYRNELLWGMDRVLEMYDENLKLNNTGNVVYCPVGYSPVWELDLPKVEEDIDICFFGAKTERRKRFLNGLRQMGGLTIYDATKNVYGEERQKYINRSKITINIKANDLWSFGPLHCLPAMANKKFMLAEKANGGYGPFKPQVHFKEYNGLKDLKKSVAYWLNAGRDARDEFAEQAHADMVKTCDFTKIFAGALKGYIKEKNDE
jgi:hypothetical protein